MKYTINTRFEIIKNEKTTTILPEPLDRVYLFKEIETKIFLQFSENSLTIEEAYTQFLVLYPDVEISEEDYNTFLNQLIARSIIVNSND